jgi:hypothetical protein
MIAFAWTVISCLRSGFVRSTPKRQSVRFKNVRDADLPSNTTLNWGVCPTEQTAERRRPNTMITNSRIIFGLERVVCKRSSMAAFYGIRGGSREGAL